MKRGFRVGRGAMEPAEDYTEERPDSGYRRWPAG